MWWLMTVAGGLPRGKAPFLCALVGPRGTSAGVPRPGHHRPVRATSPCATAQAPRPDAAEHQLLSCPFVACPCSLRSRPTVPAQPPLRAARRDDIHPTHAAPQAAAAARTDAGTRGTRQRVTWRRAPPQPTADGKAANHGATVGAAAAAGPWGDARRRAAVGGRAPPCGGGGTRATGRPSGDARRRGAVWADARPRRGAPRAPARRGVWRGSVAGGAPPHGASAVGTCHRDSFRAGCAG